MLAVRAALDELTLAKDGVDGTSVYLYGEGWNFGEVANNARFTQATQGQLGGTRDRHVLRPAARRRPRRRAVRRGPAQAGLRQRRAHRPQRRRSTSADGGGARSLHDTDLVQLGLAGNLRDFAFRSDERRDRQRGDELDYNGAPAGYADQPDEVISYVDAHDNETLFDALTFKLPVATPMADRVRMNTLSLATTALSQTPSFWHAGADLLRSKSLDRNSYD